MSSFVLSQDCFADLVSMIVLYKLQDFFLFSFCYLCVCVCVCEREREKCLGNHDRDCIDSIDGFVLYGHFNNVNSSNPRTFNIFTFIYVFFSFFH